MHYINGEFTRDANIPATDLAVLRGYGVFDYLRTYHGQPFQLHAHVQRLAHSAHLIGLALPHTIEEIMGIVCETLARNAYPESAVRIVLTGGESEDSITPLDEPRLLVFVTPVAIIPAWWYEHGVAVITERSERYIPAAKTINYLPAIVALRRAHTQGAVDAIYVDRAGYALEGTTTNLFAFFGDTLVTPDESILMGITRQVVLKLAESQFTVERRALSLQELLQADEAFLTSSNKEICPIRQIDETMIGPPGPKTRRLQQLFAELQIKTHTNNQPCPAERV